MLNRRLTALALPLALAACGGEPPPDDLTADMSPPPVVDITAVDYALQAPDTIPSGWTTFRLANRGQEPHFVMLTRMPDTVDFSRYGSEVGAAFHGAWTGLQSGELDKAGAGAMLGENLPGWYLADARVVGGPGLLSGGGTGEVTMHVPPGTYVMECYLKTADGQFHIALGMLRRLVVRADSTTAFLQEPTATVTLTDQAMSAPDRLPAGRHVVEVQFASQPPFPPAHDLHVARLDEGQDAAEVAGWMDWMDIQGLSAPGPATFVGGAEEGPAGSTAYLHLSLQPGRYLWVSEVPADRRMYQEFVVE